MVDENSMINSINGIIEAVDHGQVEIKLKEVGLSFNLFVPAASKFTINSEAVFFTYCHWNSEQGPTLFGFEDKAQRRLFVAMIGCSGIGPKMGLAILEQLGMSDFVRAITQQDIKLLSSVSGIGAKKAEQMVVQLKHKIDKLIEHQEFANLVVCEHLSEVRSVLGSLNYSTAEIARALDYVKQVPVEKSGTFDVALRSALSFLSKNV